MDKEQIKIGLGVVGAVLFFGVVIKLKVGFYPSEFPMLVGIGVVGFILLSIGAKSKLEEEDEDKKDLVLIEPRANFNLNASASTSKSGSVEPAIKYCTGCGSSNKRTNSFCCQCGSKLK